MALRFSEQILGSLFTFGLFPLTQGPDFLGMEGRKGRSGRRGADCGVISDPGVISFQTHKERVRVGHTCPRFAAQSLRGLAEVRALRPGRGQCGERCQGPPRTPTKGARCLGCLSKAVQVPSVTWQNKALLLTPPVPSGARE